MRGVTASLSTRTATNGMELNTQLRRADTEPSGATRTVVRRLRLWSRRSQLPWVYAVYHARLGQRPAGAESEENGRAAPGRCAERTPSRDETRRPSFGARAGGPCGRQTASRQEIAGR
jgi:hypothetical protein